MAEINLNYEFYFKNPRFIKKYINHGGDWSDYKRTKCLVVNLVESTRKEREITYDLTKYKNTATVHCYPTRGESVEDFWKRFEPVATAEYIRSRLNWINTAVGFIGNKSNNE